MTPRPDSSGPRRSSHGEDRPLRRRSGSDQDLIADLRRLDGRNYGAYKSVTGDWDYGDFSLAIDHVQSDPYAPPSSLRAIAEPARMGLPADCLGTVDQRLAVADFLVRALAESIRGHAPSGDVHVVRVGQEVLQRSACTVTPDRVEIRFQVRMPARGRTIQGGAAARLFDLDVPDAVMAAFDFVSQQGGGRVDALRSHVHALEDHRALQEALSANGWIAFVADGAVLARRSGISQLPMEDSVVFSSPDSLRREVLLPHAGAVSGMALEPGVTVIVGGGYHGKSTLLGALQRGVYPHVPGDGRELVATLPDAMKVRAADGRAVTGVDVSAFINHLPGGADTTRFSTENASGSTSQAASLVEAVELGSPLLLIDEDTSATNLLIRDARMRELVHADKEPITPLVDRIAGLSRERGVSTVLVMGGSGDYLDVADRVLMLDTYRCLDVTARAREVCAAMPRERSDVEGFDEVAARTPLRARGGAERPKTKATGLDQVVLDRQTVDLADVEQVVDPGQTEAIAWAMRGLLEDVFDGHTTLAAGLDRIEALLREQGLDGLTRFGARQYPAFLSRPRRVDLGAAVNRYRALHLA
ncbi:ABC-ATPase domain-containing protein [Actinomyces polynesiensis]|uniref:ABC-ATPase domain-containing protein n=1 Tax=Actinomyces polynesiensis TaxID=1325934 RepID=UPI0005B9D5AF|nr:ABC-ATPase domain-containing protein [Actinomyces polynesiensis]